nr:hypothetical protein [Nitrospira sp.]
GGALADAKQFLQELLADGKKVNAAQIEQAAHSEGHAWRTIERAKQALHIQAKKKGLEGGWVWELPPAPNSQQAPKGASPPGSVPSKAANQSGSSNPAKNNEDRHESPKAATAKGEEANDGLGQAPQLDFEAEEEVIDLC